MREVERGWWPEFKPGDPRGEWWPRVEPDGDLIGETEY